MSRPLLALGFAVLAILGASWPHPAGDAGGSRRAVGGGTFPAWQPRSLPHPRAAWLAVPEPGWLAALDDAGTLLVLRVASDALITADQHAGVGTAAAGLAAFRRGGGRWGLAFATADGQLAVWSGIGRLSVVRLEPRLSTLTYPVATDVDGDGEDELLAVGSDGSLLLIERPAADPRIGARLAVPALPDARLSAGAGGEVVLVADPTDRYAHAVLGDGLEGTSVVAVAAGRRRLALVDRWRTDGTVLEDQRAQLVDVDGDGRPEALVTEASPRDGARQLVLTRRGGRWAELARGPAVGRPHRWQHGLGAADLDGDGRLEILWLRTPHIGGVLYAAALEGGTLRPRATHPGVSSHALGSRNLDQAAIADLDGDGRPEVVVPTQSRDALVGLALVGEGFRERWRYGLRRPIHSNLVVADLDGDSRLDLAVGDAEALHVVLSRRETPQP